jgi:hypothetical protein
MYATLSLHSLGEKQRGEMEHDLPLYRINGVTVETEIPFPELPRSSAKPDCSFVVRGYQDRVTRGIKWTHETVLSNARPWLLVGESGTRLVMRFPDLVDFVISPEENKVFCFARPTVPNITARHLFLDNVLPAYLSLSRLVLHASAIRMTKKSAIAFMGPTGSGKSTLAACFWKEGYQVIADDCTVVEHANGLPMCFPSYPGLRLWDDSAKAVLSSKRKRLPVAHYTNKARFKHSGTDDAFESRALPLSRIYLLESAASEGASGISIHPVSGSRGLVEFLQSSFRLNFTRPELLAEEFDRLARIANSELLYRITFPRDFRRVRELTRAILDHAGH